MKGSNDKSCVLWKKDTCEKTDVVSNRKIAACIEILPGGPTLPLPPIMQRKTAYVSNADINTTRSGTSGPDNTNRTSTRSATSAITFRNNSTRDSASHETDMVTKKEILQTSKPLAKTPVNFSRISTSLSTRAAKFVQVSDSRSIWSWNQGAVEQLQPWLSVTATISMPPNPSLHSLTQTLNTILREVGIIQQNYGLKNLTVFSQMWLEAYGSANLTISPTCSDCANSRPSEFYCSKYLPRLEGCKATFQDDQRQLRGKRKLNIPNSGGNLDVNNKSTSFAKTNWIFKATTNVNTSANNTNISFVARWLDGPLDLIIFNLLNGTRIKDQYAINPSIQIQQTNLHITALLVPKDRQYQQISVLEEEGLKTFGPLARRLGGYLDVQIAKQMVLHIKSTRKPVQQIIIPLTFPSDGQMTTKAATSEDAGVTDSDTPDTITVIVAIATAAGLVFAGIVTGSVLGVRMYFIHQTKIGNETGNLKRLQKWDKRAHEEHMPAPANMYTKESKNDRIIVVKNVSTKPTS